MADEYINQLPPVTSVASTDIIPVEVNPSTTPVTSYIQVGNLATSLGMPSPSNTVSSQLAFGMSATPGLLSTYSRGDHNHGTPVGQALTKIDDTNVTLTLGGSPSGALVLAASLTLGWSGQLSVARGGTAKSSWTQYGIVYAPTTGSLGQLGLGTTTQVLHGNAAGAAAFGSVVEGDLGLTDLTTANVSTSAHGFAPKATAPAANVRTALVIDNGETLPTFKVTLDSTNPTTIGIADAASPGTSLIYSHRDHQHASPATWTATAHNVFSATHPDALPTSPLVRGSIPYVNATPQLATLAKGAAGTFPVWDATDLTVSKLILTQPATSATLTIADNKTVAINNSLTISGTDGGALSLAVTNTKTLTLTATDNYNLTIPATGTAALLGIANVFTANQQITVPTTTLTGLVLKTSDDNTTNNLLKLLSSGNVTLASISAVGKALFGGGLFSPWTRYLVVDAGGKGDYTTISAAIAATDGINPYVIHVMPGTYAEVDLVIKEHTTIIGSGAANTTIGGATSGTATFGGGATYTNVDIYNCRIQSNTTGDTTTFKCYGISVYNSYINKMTSSGSARTYSTYVGSPGQGSISFGAEIASLSSGGSPSGTGIAAYISATTLGGENASVWTASYFPNAVTSGSIKGYYNADFFSGNVTLNSANCNAYLYNTSFAGNFTWYSGGVHYPNVLYNCIVAGTLTIGSGDVGTLNIAGGFYGAITGLTESNLSYNALPYRMTTPTATVTPLIVKGKASQTATMQEWQDSSANILGSISSAGIVNHTALDVTTNAVVNVLTLGKNVSGGGHGADSLGNAIVFQLADTTTDNTSVARIRAVLDDATHASYKSSLTLSAWDSGAERDVISIGANGSAGTLGFFGVTKMAQEANTIALDTLLVNYGLRASGGYANFDTTIQPRAGTTAANTAPLKFTTQASGLTTVEQGAMELIGNSLQFTQLAKRRGVAMTQNTRTSDFTLAASGGSSESAAVATSSHGANYLEVGKMEEIVLVGTMSQRSNPNANLTVRVKYAGSTVLTFATAISTVIAANSSVLIRVYCTCRTTGATGTMQVNAVLEINGTATDPQAASLVTIDTTTAQDTTVTFQWGTDTDAANTITIHQARVLCVEPSK